MRSSRRTPGAPRTQPELPRIYDRDSSGSFLLSTRGDAVAFRPVLDDSGDRAACILKELDDVPFHAEAGLRHRDQLNFSHTTRIPSQVPALNVIGVLSVLQELLIITANDHSF